MDIPDKFRIQVCVAIAGMMEERAVYGLWRCKGHPRECGDPGSSYTLLLN